jgi:hypothetical protein
LNNYIYEMHVALLRMQYLLPDGFNIYSVSTKMKNRTPHDLTELEMEYEAVIFTKEYNENKDKIEIKVSEVPTADSLQELTEKVRVWSVKRKLQTVNKAVCNFDNSMTNQGA